MPGAPKGPVRQKQKGLKVPCERHNSLQQDPGSNDLNRIFPT